MFEEEQPILVFSVKDDDGNVVYRDSITFRNITEMRNTNQAERQTLMQARYQEWLRLKEEAENSPPIDEEVSEEEPEGE